ncbi:MAG: hypothetical protein OXC95_13115 [Dehalococcoidia bacterium]|nr:hypothetical protein [Dehalococcoidia bacterium]
MVQTTEETRKNLSATTASEDEVTYEDVARAWRKSPMNVPLPDTPEMRELVIDLVLEMYGPALRELEKS